MKDEVAQEAGASDDVDGDVFGLVAGEAEVATTATAGFELT